MIYTKTPDKRKKTSTSSDPHSDLIYHHGHRHHDNNNLLHSNPLKVADHVTEGLQIIRNVMEGDYAAISKRLATGQSMMSVREPGTGSSIAHVAARRGDKAILKLLLRMYSDYTKMSNNSGRTAVHEAAEHGKFVCLTYLLQHGAVCKTRDRNGVTPLMLSAQKGHLQTLRRLALADPDAMTCSDMDGCAALHHAAAAGKEAVVRWLVEFGAEDHAKDKAGNTALHHAVTNNHLQCAIWLHHFSNCDVRQINSRGHNAGHIASARGHLPLLRWLLSNQLLSPNEPGGMDGSTPVHVAAAKGQLESLKCLKNFGAAMHKKNFNDKSPKDVAAANKHSDCVRFLDSIKKPKTEKFPQLTKRANSLTRIVQALSISSSEEKPPKALSLIKTKRNGKQKGPTRARCLSDTQCHTETDTFASWPCERLNFARTLSPGERRPRNDPGRPRNDPGRPRNDPGRPRAGSMNSNRSMEDSRSVYSNGSSGVFKQNSWVGSSSELIAVSPASTSSTGFDIMQVLRDEQRRHTSLRSDEEDIRSNGSSLSLRDRSRSLLSSERTLDRSTTVYTASPRHLSPPPPPPRSVTLQPPRNYSGDRNGTTRSRVSMEIDLRLHSPVPFSDRSSLALSDSSTESGRPYPRTPPCPVHSPSSPSRFNTDDFRKVFSDRHQERVTGRCSCRDSSEALPREPPERPPRPSLSPSSPPPRHLVPSRSSTGSDYALSPTGSGGSGVTTLRRNNEINRLDLDSFKTNWGTRTLGNHGYSNHGTRTLGPGLRAPGRGTPSSAQGFGIVNGQSHGTPCKGTEHEAEEKGRQYRDVQYRDGTTFRTSTNLSDICKL